MYRRIFDSRVEFLNICLILAPYSIGVRKFAATYIHSFITYADDSKTFSGVCESVSLFVRMIKPKRLKQQLPNLLQR